MKTKYLVAFLAVYLAYYPCSGQTNILDSCGINDNPELNQYEIRIIDSLFFTPFTTKKPGVIDPKKGFDFKNKKIAFFSCTKNSNTKGNGLLSKKEFFELGKPAFKGHAGRGLITFTENERKASGGFDAVIVIDCPYDSIDNKDLVSKLIIKQ